MTTRSATLFANVVPATTFVVVYTSPSLVVTLLKSVLLNNTGPNTQQLQLYLQRPSLGVGMRLLDEPVVAGGKFYWEGWVALEPGDQLVAYGSASIMWCWGSGAQLPVTT